MSPFKALRTPILEFLHIVSQLQLLVPILIQYKVELPRK
jgi:hypothetical protein